MVWMCVCACGSWYVSDLSQKNITGSTANEEIWDDIDIYCCVGFHVKLDTVCLSLQCFLSELNQIQWWCWIPLYCGWMPYGKGFVETDDVDRWFLCSSSSCVFLIVSPAVPVFIFYRFPQVPLGLWVRSGGGLWSSGDIRGTSPGFL